MRHNRSGRKLGRVSEHRRALFRNQLRSLIAHERIITTLPKAKELRPIAEKRRDPRPADRLRPRAAPRRPLDRRPRPRASRLFTEIGPRFVEPPGRLHPHREARARGGATAPSSPSSSSSTSSCRRRRARRPARPRRSARRRRPPPRRPRPPAPHRSRHRNPHNSTAPGLPWASFFLSPLGVATSTTELWAVDGLTGTIQRYIIIWLWRIDESWPCAPRAPDSRWSLMRQPRGGQPLSLGGCHGAGSRARAVTWPRPRPGAGGGASAPRQAKGFRLPERVAAGDLGANGLAGRGLRLQAEPGTVLVPGLRGLGPEPTPSL